MNMPRQPAERGRYLYGVVSLDRTQHAQGSRIYGSIGVGGERVYTIPDGDVAAVVSDISDQKVRPQRCNLAAHQEVLKRLMEETTPLPMSFGIIADSTEEIARILSSNRDAFIEQLERVKDKVEMGLRVSWDVPNIFEYIVDTNPELRDLRDRLFRGGREPSRGEKMNLGRLFERILREERADHTAKVKEALQPRCFEIGENKPKDERQVVNLACLVGRDDQKGFEDAVFEAAGLFDDNYAFDYNGPWPPYNFVEMSLQIDERQAAARDA